MGNVPRNGAAPHRPGRRFDHSDEFHRGPAGGLVGVAHYTAAKHGVVGLMRSLAKELAPHNIRVNTVHPTNVDTPMIQNDHVRGAFRPDLREVTREQFAEVARSMNVLAIPWVEPVDVANACLFLASDEARYITSVSLPVDAGSSKR
jgi:NAD(P)-dependent dehydrogenase (short-subunit alcohol dehydrogenase family)